MPCPPTIAPGVVEIDTLLGGWERVTAGYLHRGPAPVLVETGSQTSVPVLLEALAGLGVGPDDLAGVVVTHIHLDHAGGVGDVARAFPAATVYVHEKGARHLADPDAARRLGGPGLRAAARLASTAGSTRPPAERIHVLDDGEEIALGHDRVLVSGRLARARQAPPGPARLRRAGSSSPATPSGSGCPTPASCARPRRRPTSTSTRPCTRCSASPSAGRPASPSPTTASFRGPRRAARRGRRHAAAPGPAMAERPARAGEDIAEALDGAFAVDLRTASTPSGPSKLETLNGVHSNAAGFSAGSTPADLPTPPQETTRR